MHKLDDSLRMLKGYIHLPRDMEEECAVAAVLEVCEDGEAGEAGEAYERVWRSRRGRDVEYVEWSSCPTDMYKVS